MPAGMVHLHVHSEFSSLDGLDSPTTLVKAGVANGDKAMGLTDHGVMGGIPEFYWMCKKEGIEPVIGCEFFFAPDFEASVRRHRTSNFHVVILAKNQAGVETLIELCSIGHRQFYQKPLIDRATIRAIDTSNLVCLTGCAGSIISRKAIGEERGDIDKEISWWKRQFCRNNLFVELQQHNTDFDHRLNMALIDLARKHGLPLVVTNDPHYAMPEDACCPAGTAVATPTGQVSIEDLRYGDIVLGYDHQTESVVPAKVTRTFINSGKGKSLFGNGQLQTTGNHPWWTENNGYVSLHDVWRRSSSQALGHQAGPLHLLPHMRQPQKLAVAGRTYGSAQPGRHYSLQGERNQEGQGFLQVLDQSWQGDAHACDSTSAFGTSRFSLEDRICGQNWQQDLPLLLLARPGSARLEDQRGDRWARAQDWQEEGQRSETRRVADTTRVASLAVHKCGSHCQCRVRGEADQVFNVETETGNYFAEGVLVHNCHHDALLAIQTGSDIDAPDRFRFSGEGYHLKTRTEMRRAFQQYGDAVWREGVGNTLAIARMCKTEIPAWEARTWHIPRALDVEDATATLREAVRAGLRDRGLHKDPKYVERARHELRRFKEVPRMADFLLITAEANAFARSQGIGVGPGRGSVCGSFVCYLLGIHKIDSVRYNLLFERFLNPERPKMPDIDTDFERRRRHEMFDWARDRFGNHNVMLVSAYGTMKLKRAFQSLARAHGIEFQERLRISKEIIEDEEGNAIIPQEVADAYPGLVDQLNRLEGTKASISRHPAGLLIFDADDPVRKLIPEQWVASSKQMVSQFDLDTVNHIGLMKQDFLGLRNIDVITECVRLVKERTGQTIDPDSWVPDEEPGDDVVYRMLKLGKVTGIFQMEGSSNAKGIRQIKPTEFEDIVSCTSLYRKGPIMAGAPERFLRNKKDKEVRVAHPSLEPYLSVSWGEMIYQEQMFEILHNLAGMSWAQVDDVKTAMTKKDAEMMKVLMKDALTGFRNGGMDLESAKEVVNMIQQQAAYLFNRSHAVAYSMLTYQTARLKFLHPLEFMIALLRTLEPNSTDAKDKQMAYLAECTAYGFHLLPPDINLSQARFSAEGDMSIRWGLQDVKGVGEKAVAKILEGRAQRKKFRRVTQAQIAANNEGVIRALTKAGAFDSLGVPTMPEDQEEVCGWQFYDPIEQFREEWTDRIVRPKGSGSNTMIAGDLQKVEHKTTKRGDPYASWTVRWTPAETWKVTVWSSASEHHSLNPGSVVVCAGKWNDEFGNLSIGDPDNICVLLSR